MPKKIIVIIFMLGLFLSDISVAAATFKNINLPDKSDLSVGFDSKILLVQDYVEIFSEIYVSLSNGLTQAVILPKAFRLIFFSHSKSIHFIAADIISRCVRYGFPLPYAQIAVDKNRGLARLSAEIGFLIVSFMLAYLGLLRLFSDIFAIKYTIKNPGFAY